MSENRKYCKSLFVALALTAAAGPSAAQGSASYPERPVRIIVGSAPGGATDIVARILGPKLTEILRQPMVIDNRPGASGNIGVGVAARAAPDGHTLFLANVAMAAMNPYIYPGFPVKPARDFAAITQVVDVPGALIANPAAGLKTVRDLVDLAKANPGKVNVSTTATSRLDIEYLMRAAGIKLTHVEYKGGAGPVMTGVMTNEIPVAMLTLSSVVGIAKTGKVTLLAVLAARRIPGLTDVPTLAESGFPAMTSGAWQGFFAPRGTPQAIVEKIHNAAVRAVQSPDTSERLMANVIQPVTSASPREFGAYVQAENVRWAKVVADAGLTAQ